MARFNSTGLWKKYNAEYSAWYKAVHRCTNPAASQWKRYGGRGITICKEWQADFKAFLDHIGPKPNPSYVLDRVDNDKGYEPGNVRWISPTESARNKSNTIRVEFNGEFMTIKEWAERIGIKSGTLRRRLNSGWNIEAALTEKVVTVADTKRIMYTHDGLTLSAKEWAEKLGIPKNTLKHRIKMGFPPEKVFTSENLRDYPIQRKVYKNSPLYTYDGKTQTVPEWAREYSIPYQTLRNRLLRRKWPIEQALLTPVGNQWNNKAHPNNGTASANNDSSP